MGSSATGVKATGVKNVRQSHAPDVIRDLVNRMDAGGPAWKEMLDDLAAHNGASLHVSTFVKGSSVCIDHARKTGSGHVDPIEPSGFHMVSMSRKNTRIQWDVPRSKSSVVVVNLLIDLSNNIDHNLYLTLSRNIGQALRFSNTSLTWIESASVIPVDEGLNFITLALSDEHAHIFVNGELKLRKKRKIRDEIDRVLFNLMSHESADLGAVFYGLEVWEQDSIVKGFENSDASSLQGELSKLINKGRIADICSFLTTYDDVDLAPMSNDIVRLLDKSLKADEVYPDWAVEQILQALPEAVAGNWRSTRKDKLPTPNIQVDSLFVRLYRNPATKWALSNLVRLRKADTFLAINDVNFNIYPGDIVGIIGANGAGKSTLLKTINNLIPVESGTITLMDKPLLLSPGLGIRDELSGKKNIQLVCCYMGLSEEESALLYDEIVEFSELQEFIDQPYKFYSDGMKSRLVFSIATAVAPNIMMLDELLNAGDVGFQQKAARRMEEVIDRAKSVVVVTHSIPFVLERCNKAVLLHLGKQIAYGDPRSVVARYLDILQIGDMTDISGIIVGSG